jgi:hypothetical protein
MEATDDLRTYFYIQSLATGADGQLRLLRPQRITMDSQTRPDNCQMAAEPQ